MTPLTPTPLPKRARGFNWHKRYLQQANWTRELREYIFGEIGLDESSRALEVGCGTGAILSQIDIPVYGLDIALASVKEAKFHTQNISHLTKTLKVSGNIHKNYATSEKKKLFRQHPHKKPLGSGYSPPLTCGDALSLPYADSSFDLVFCHFLLLWLPQPEDALREMIRVSKADAHIIAFAEPDYSKRIDKPDLLVELGQWQTDALRKQGANPSMGADLTELFYGAGITIIERGAISTSTRVPLNLDEQELEWATLEADLTGEISDERIQKMKAVDKVAWARGERILYVPTHYIWGKNKV